MKRVILCSLFLLAFTQYGYAQYTPISVINKVVVNNREFVIEQRTYHGEMYSDTIFEAYFVDERNIHTKENRLYYYGEGYGYSSRFPRENWIKAIKQTLSVNTINSWTDNDSLWISVSYDGSGNIIQIYFRYNTHNGGMNLNKIPIKELALLGIALKDKAKMKIMELQYPTPNHKYELRSIRYFLNVKKLLNNTPDYYLNNNYTDTIYRDSNRYRITQYLNEKSIIADKTKRSINSKVNIDGRNFLIETDEHGYYAYFEDEKQVNGKPIIDADTCIDAKWLSITSHPTKEDWIYVIKSSISAETLDYISDEHRFYGRITLDNTGSIRQVQLYSDISYAVWYFDIGPPFAMVNGNMYNIWNIISPEEFARLAINIEKALRYGVTLRHVHSSIKNGCYVLKVSINIRNILNSNGSYP